MRSFHDWQIAKTNQPDRRPGERLDDYSVERILCSLTEFNLNHLAITRSRLRTKRQSNFHKWLSDVLVDLNPIFVWMMMIGDKILDEYSLL